VVASVGVGAPEGIAMMFRVTVGEPEPGNTNTFWMDTTSASATGEGASRALFAAWVVSKYRAREMGEGGRLRELVYDHFKGVGVVSRDEAMCWSDRELAGFLEGLLSGLKAEIEHWRAKALGGLKTEKEM
jgi:hypothetical protein